MKSRLGDVTDSIVLMKGSVPTYQYDSDTYNFPKYEMNFTYLFGLNKFHVDGYLELDTGVTYFIIPDEFTKDYYHHLISKQEALENYGVNDVLTKSEFL